MMRSENNVERGRCGRSGFNLRRIILGAETIAVGAGVYLTSLGYHSENESVTTAGGALLLMGLGGLVYSFIKK